MVPPEFRSVELLMPRESKDVMGLISLKNS